MSLAVGCRMSEDEDNSWDDISVLTEESDCGHENVEFATLESADFGAPGAEWVKMEDISEWAYGGERQLGERTAKLEWAAARPLSQAALTCDLLAPLAWLFEKVSTQMPYAARAYASGSPRRFPRGS